MCTGGPLVVHGLDSGRRCCRLRRFPGGAAELERGRLRILPRAAGIRTFGGHDHAPFWTLDDDEPGVDDGAASWQRSRLDPVGPGVERATSDVPTEAHPVDPGMPGDAEAADVPAIRRYLNDHELHGSRSSEAEHEHRLPAPPWSRARDPVTREVQPVDSRPAWSCVVSRRLASGACIGAAGR